MRLIDADGLKKHKVYSEERHEYVVPVYNIDNAPTVELFCSYLSDEEVRQPCVEAPCKHEKPIGTLDIGGHTIAYPLKGEKE